jgi:hypothetical protein
MGAEAPRDAATEASDTAAYDVADDLQRRVEW